MQAQNPGKSWNQLPWKVVRSLSHTYPTFCLDSVCWQSRRIDVSGDLDFISWLLHYILPTAALRSSPREEAGNSRCCHSCTGWPGLSFPFAFWSSWGPRLLAASQSQRPPGDCAGTHPFQPLSTVSRGPHRGPSEWPRSPFIILLNMSAGAVYRSKDSLAKCTACSPGFHVIMKWRTSKTS